MPTKIELLPSASSWRGLALICLLALAQPLSASEGLPTLTPEELGEYAFKAQETNAKVTELNVGQRQILHQQRREINDLVARRLGVLRLAGNKRDLDTIQEIIDRGLIGKRETRAWQGLGVVLGDVLVRELGLHWVSYEDDLGLSRALRWKDTENYVFPVTMFSKRVRFDEDMDAHALFEQVAEQVAEFERAPRLR